jgi:solute carrier family 25 (adenine nucleotide translocator) protein 4/5/6/31
MCLRLGGGFPNPHLCLAFLPALLYAYTGLMSFWRGNGANLLRYFPHQALSFAFKDKLKASMAAAGAEPEALYKVIARNVASAGAGGGMSLVLLYPLDMARTRLAADVGKNASDRRFNGTYDCLRKINAESGLQGIYTGLGVSITGVIVFRGLFMGGYDTAKYLLGLDSDSGGGSGSELNVNGRTQKEEMYANFTANILTRLGAAQVVTLTAGTLCYPIDTVRRRVMMQSKIPKPSAAQLPSATTVTGAASGAQLEAVQLRYTGAIHAFTTILREEGARGLYSGLSANLIRGIAGPILLVSYDVIRLVLSVDQ